jgi:hypothetical protein
MSEVTKILEQIEQGDTAAAAELLPLVYAELRKLAGYRLEREKPGQLLVACRSAPGDSAKSTLKSFQRTLD